MPTAPVRTSQTRLSVVAALLALCVASQARAQSDTDHASPIVPSGDTSPGVPDPGTTGETGNGVPNRVPSESGAPTGNEGDTAAADTLPAPPGQAPTSVETPAPVYPPGYEPPQSAMPSSYVAPDYESEALGEEPELEGAREHDGFFLRLSVGPGAGGARYREQVGDRVSTIEARGLAGLFDVAVGARVVGNLIVHGNLLFTRFDSPTRRVDGVKDAALHVTHTSTMLGPGVSYYFMPLNVYLTTSVGLAWAFERRAREQLRSGTGGFAVFAAGKEWWVGRSGSWGLGTALRTTFAAAPIDIAGVESKLKIVTIGLAFSATYN